MSFVEILNALKLEGKQLIIQLIKSEPFQQLLSKLKTLIQHPYVLRFAVFIAIIYIIKLIRQQIKAIDDIKYQRDKKYVAKKNNYIQYEVKAFDKNFKEKDPREAIAIEERVLNEQDSMPPNHQKSHDIQYYQYNYDDDTYQKININQAKELLIKYDQNRQQQKPTIEQIITKRRQQKALNAKNFIKDLQKTKQKVILSKLLNQNQPSSIPQPEFSRHNSGSSKTLGRLCMKQLQQDEDSMSVDSLSVVSADSACNYLQNEPIKSFSGMMEFNQINEVEVDQELSNDEYESPSHYSIAQTPLNKLKTRKGEIEVKPQDLKKKNDCLFFELFTYYTKQSIKTDSSAPQKLVQ